MCSLENVSLFIFLVMVLEYPYGDGSKVYFSEGKLFMFSPLRASSSILTWFSLLIGLEVSFISVRAWEHVIGNILKKHNHRIFQHLADERQFIFQKNQVGEPKSFRIRCSTTSFCMSCTCDDKKSFISCINFGSSLLFKYHHRKVRASCITELHFYVYCDLTWRWAQISKLFMLALVCW